VSCGFDRADVVICIGFDMVEYHPQLWNPQGDKKIIHIDQTYAEVDAHYQLEVGVLGEISKSLELIAQQATAKESVYAGSLREIIKEQIDSYSDDNSFPIKPQRILYDTRQVLADGDILLSDVGAHKMWIARLFHCEQPNTCIISNGFASMGIALPGALAAKMAYPQKRVLAITGDAGFLMNSQEIETALRYNLALVVMIWHDKEYGLIKWHQQRRFGRSGNISFNNPDFVKYAESFGAIGYRVDSAEELIPTLEDAFAQNTVVIVDVPVDYSENMKLTKQLGELVCTI
jgi:acetolactate synthase-1/2/3 large subunit